MNWLDALSKLNPVAVLTIVVVVVYGGASAWAFAASGITWQEFSGAVGPIAGTLLGYWMRGVKSE